MINSDAIRAQFPILNRQINGHTLVYFDNAATSQKPQVVIDALVDYYTQHNANVHRGVHTLSDESTTMYEQARQTVAQFIHAEKPQELIFVRNTTEATNLVAFSWARHQLQPNDEIVVTELEHHSNLLPWQRVCEETGAKLIICPVDGNGDLSLETVISSINQRVKLVCITQVSNVLGTIVDIQHVIKAIKHANRDTHVLVDGAQATPHLPINVKDYNVDFYTFSGHKMLGPQGIGGLYIKRQVMEQCQPYLVGGGMINEVYEDHATWADIPDRFDAGTPNVADAVGLAAACIYLDHIGMENILEHEQQLTAYAIEQLSLLEAEGWLEIYGKRDSQQRGGIVTFNLKNIHAHDTAQILDRECGIAVRSGHHCNQLLTRKLGVPATVRASFYLYNTQDEIDQLIAGLRRVKEIMH
jgi:cysteine desulfurase/selenocysteine lyase